MIYDQSMYCLMGSWYVHGKLFFKGKIISEETLKIMDAILAKKASVDIYDDDGNSPLTIAIERESVEAVDRLLKADSNLLYQGKKKCRAYEMSLLCKLRLIDLWLLNSDILRWPL